MLHTITRVCQQLRAEYRDMKHNKMHLEFRTDKHDKPDGLNQVEFDFHVKEWLYYSTPEERASITGIKLTSYRLLNRGKHYIPLDFSITVVLRGKRSACCAASLNNRFYMESRLEHELKAHLLEQIFTGPLRLCGACVSDSEVASGTLHLWQ